MQGRFTGGAYPTFAAAAAYWLAEGPKTEMAEWALRWAREFQEDVVGAMGARHRADVLGGGGHPRRPPHGGRLSGRLAWTRLPGEGWPDDLGLTLVLWSSSRSSKERR